MGQPRYHAPLCIDHSVLSLPCPVLLPRRSSQSVTTHILACSEFSCCLGFPGPLTRVVHIAPTIRILLLCSAVLLFPPVSLRAPSYHHPWLSCSHAHIRARTVTSPTYRTSRSFGSYSAPNISRDPGPRKRFHDLITTTTTGLCSCLISICFRLNLGACDVLYFYVNRAYCLPYVSWLPQPVLF